MNVQFYLKKSGIPYTKTCYNHDNGHVCGRVYVMCVWECVCVGVCVCEWGRVCMFVVWACVCGVGECVCVGVCVWCARVHMCDRVCGGRVCLCRCVCLSVCVCVCVGFVMCWCSGNMYTVP